MRNLRIAIIGAGPGGLCTAIQLQKAGFEDFVILEKGDGVGGTWYHNRYPGCACDIPSFLYSFSFAPKNDWSRPYGSQEEILGYMEELADEYGLLPHCRFHSEVKAATWSDASARWRLELASDDGSRQVLEADVVVSALGMFNELAWPDIEGLDAFAGTSFHSARWDWNHDLTGETVGVIGSAASAVQFVPEIAKVAGRVHLFQRTANWVMPKEDAPFTEEMLELFRTSPEAVQAARDEIYQSVDEGMTFSDPAAVQELADSVMEALEVVEDPAVRAKLVPNHPFGCKRPLLSNEYYPVFNRDDVELVTEGIERVTKGGVVTVDGVERRVDTLILATGFSATKYLSAIDVTGRGGVKIDDAWNDGARAYLGITTSGFPNLFMIYGPNTNNGSILTMIESQVGYIVSHVQRIAHEELAWIDVRAEAMEAFNDEIQRGIQGVSVWQHDCHGYYRSPSGRIVTQWPFSMSEFQRRTEKPDPEVYDTAPLVETPAA